jgi:hypothetical protein
VELTGATGLSAFTTEGSGSGNTNGTESEVPQANLTDTSMTATIQAKSSGSEIDMLEGDYSMSINFNVTAQ